MDLDEIIDRKNKPVAFNIKCTNNDTINFTGRPCELSAFSHVPQNRLYESADRSIFNTKRSDTKEKNISDYDRLFNVKYDFDYKVHRCDRKHGTKTTGRLLGLDPWSEEINKLIPTRFSHEYGKKLIKIKEHDPLKIKYESNLDPPDRKFTRIAIVQSDFYNRNGINDLNKQRGVL
jgi:hypothetical protein